MSKTLALLRQRQALFTILAQPLPQTKSSKEASFIPPHLHLTYAACSCGSSKGVGQAQLPPSLCPPPAYPALAGTTPNSTAVSGSGSATHLLPPRYTNSTLTNPYNIHPTFYPYPRSPTQYTRNYKSRPHLHQHTHQHSYTRLKPTTTSHHLHPQFNHTLNTITTLKNISPTHCQYCLSIYPSSHSPTSLIFNSLPLTYPLTLSPTHSSSKHNSFEDHQETYSLTPRLPFQTLKPCRLNYPCPNIKLVCYHQYYS